MDTATNELLERIAVAVERQAELTETGLTAMTQMTEAAKLIEELKRRIRTIEDRIVMFHQLKADGEIKVVALTEEGETALRALLNPVN